METIDGLLPRTNLLHQLGRLCNVNNHMESELWIHKKIGSRCSPWPRHTLLASNHITHLTFNGQIDKATSH
jgi:hypothetical protein